MTEQDLALVFAALIFAAFMVGWLAHWIWSRFARRPSAQAEKTEAMAAMLLQAEAERDAVSAAKAETESSMTSAFGQREAELEVRLRETEAELAAAMDGLRAARAELQARD